jgi:hypothetical protein
MRRRETRQPRRRIGEEASLPARSLPARRKVMEFNQLKIDKRQHAAL